VDAASDLMPLGLDCEIAVEAATSRLGRLGLRVLRSFDLSTAACVSDPDMPCPHHGTSPCDCQLVVLLVYGEGGPPVSVVAHGHDQQTWFSVVEEPGQPLEESTRRQVAVMFEEWGLSAGSPDTRNPAM
jgi:nitrous oxide reductase accessory protein NosL